MRPAARRARRRRSRAVPREATVGRERARDVRCIAVDLAGRVDQHQVAVLHHGMAGRIVQHTGIATGRHDRWVGGRLRSLPAELVQQFGLDLVLAHADAAGLHGARVRRRRDAGSTAHGFDFARILDETHLVDERRQVVCGRRRTSPRARLRADSLQPSLHARVERRIHAQCVEERRAVREQLGQDLVHPLDRMRGVKTEGALRQFGTVAEPVPQLALLVLFPAEQDRLPLPAVRDQDERAVRFREPGQIPERTVVAVRVLGVAVAQALGRREVHGHAATTIGHGLQQARPALSTAIDVHRRILGPVNAWLARAPGLGAL